MPMVRSLSLFRQVKSTFQPNSVFRNQIRNSSGGFVYRTTGHHANKKWEPIAEGCMAIAWWWFLWHVYYEYEWVTGEWDVPNTRKWTDEELGIPPDDVDTKRVC